ncbi:Lar family restriction alleviation protein [Candidatus Pacearchaeota archaeon]|nr:Lar family restriction alleviation protein [Candidatus Pacearchaeota archaeon]
MISEKDNKEIEDMELSTDDKKSSVEGRVIKRCPFCGGDAKLEADIDLMEVYVECYVCGARGPYFDSGEDNKATEDWNKRAL